MVFCFSKSSVQVIEPMPNNKHEVGETADGATQLAGKFGQFVEDQSSKFQHDKRFAKGLVRYKDLKQHMNNMNNKYGTKLEERRCHMVDDECAVCLEELGHACDVTKTACGHSFHTFCLVETLGNGSCTSCPLCRTDVSKLVPGSMDGSTLKLMAKLRINVDAAQWCHQTIYDEIQTKTVECLREAEATNAWRTRVLPFSSSSMKKDKLRARVEELLEQLELLEHFGQINSEGFSKICQKINKKISSELAEAAQEKYVNQNGFHKDCVKEGNGMTQALREELKCILRLLQAKPVWRKGAVAPATLVETTVLSSAVDSSRPQSTPVTTVRSEAENDSRPQSTPF